MCGDTDAPPFFIGDYSAAEGFPWEVAPVSDAHCHPTDTMALVSRIPAMRAAALTVMATRSQDQDLVAQLMQDDRVAARIVPAFGWHPWFSYQLYDDKDKGGPDLTDLDDIRRHLAAVLVPNPVDSEYHAAHLEAIAKSLVAVQPISKYIAAMRARLEAHPQALVGEIGLDKAFRVPEAAVETTAGEQETSEKSPAEDKNDENDEEKLTPGTREGRRLSPFRVLPAHQVAVLAAQVQLAAALERPVSVHGVQMHGQLFGALSATWRGHERDVLSRRERRQIAAGAEQFEQFEEDSDEEDSNNEQSENPQIKAKPYPPTICLHSFSGPVEVLRQYLDERIPALVFFSFSTCVNFSTATGLRRSEAVIAACPADRILVESDLHLAGQPMEAALADVCRRVCAIKGWTLTEGVQQFARNYDAFLQRTKDTRKRV